MSPCFSCLRTGRDFRIAFRRDAHPQSGNQAATKIRLSRKDRDDLSSPASSIVTERSADGAIVGAVKRVRKAS
jgi:hypothetical protein